MGYYIDSNAFSKSITDGLFIPRVIGVKYDKGSAILFNKAIYFANKITQWTGELNEDWDPYISAGGNNQIFDFIGIVDLISDLPVSANDGNYIFVKENQHTYFYYNGSWSDAGELIVGNIDSITKDDLDELKAELEQKDQLILTESKEYTDKLAGKNVYDSTKTYSKYDEVYFIPDSYDLVTYASGQTKTHIGQNVRYLQETKARRFDVRFRAAIDNARNPTNYPSDWIPIDPMAVIEQGTNSNGEYFLYANGTSMSYMAVYVSSASKVTWTQSQGKPIYTLSNRNITVNHNSAGGTHFPITSIDQTGETIQITAYEINNTAQNWSGIVRMSSNDVWYWL